MQKKNNKGLIAVIIVLFLLIIGLLCYIILDKKEVSVEDETTTTLTTKSTTTTTVTTTTTTKALYSGDADGVFRLKVENNKLYTRFVDFDYEYIYENNIYYILTSGNYNSKIQINYNYPNTIFYIDDKKIESIYLGGQFLKQAKLYNNFLYVELVPFEEQPKGYVIDLQNKKVIENVCVPEENGKCIGYTYGYEDVYQIETEYSVDYTNELTKTIINEEKFKCETYQESSFDYENCNKDEKCKRRYPRCVGP